MTEINVGDKVLLTGRGWKNNIKRLYRQVEVIDRVEWSSNIIKYWFTHKEITGVSIFYMSSIKDNDWYGELVNHTKEGSISVNPEEMPLLNNIQWTEVVCSQYKIEKDIPLSVFNTALDKGERGVRRRRSWPHKMVLKHEFKPGTPSIIEWRFEDEE